MSEIWLAEDNPSDVYLIGEALKEHGIRYPLRVASNGRDALDLVARGATAQPPDLIILDLNLPRHDGMEILQALSSTEAFAQVPVVVLTSSDSPSDRQAALEWGARRYLRKPFNLEKFFDLGAVFKELLDQTRRDGASACA